MPRHYLKEISPEERKRNLELARVAKEAKVEAAYPDIANKFRVKEPE